MNKKTAKQITGGLGNASYDSQETKMTTHNATTLKRIARVACVCGGKLVKPTKVYMNISGPMKNVVICEQCEMMFGEKA